MTTKARLEERLKELESEFENGQNVLADLEAKTNNVKESLLRIAGAIQVIKEILQKDEQDDTPGAVQPDA